MIAHILLSISDFPRSEAFYSVVLAPLGYNVNMEYSDAAGFSDGKNTDFWISDVQTVVPTHVAFEAADRYQVEAFHEAGLASGAKDNGDPGYRDYRPGYFAAFLLDPDGNNIEAAWYDHSKSK